MKDLTLFRNSPCGEPSGSMMKKATERSSWEQQRGLSSVPCVYEKAEDGLFDLFDEN